MSGPFDLFSHTVPEAHAKFVNECRRAGIEVEEVEHPLTDPDGRTIHSAVARVGDFDASRVLLCISGTHGIEGYFGSAMQIDAMARWHELLDPHSDTAIVFVHLVNPWGTAWSSRENEDNVELLRGHYYCHVGKPPNPIFADFADTMGFSRIRSLDEFLDSRSRAIEVVQRHGLAGLMRALVDGQNTHPDTITFIGNGPTWSKRLLDRVAGEHLSLAEQVLVLDLHTAVGPPNETILFHPYEPGSEVDRLFAEHLGDLWPNDERIPFYDWLVHLVPDADVRTLVCEAGTEQLGPLDQYIFPLDVWIKHYGERNDPAARPHLERYRRFFYPETEEWMAAVYEHFVPRWPGFLSLLSAPWPSPSHV